MIVANQNVLSFVNGASQVVKTLPLIPKNFSFDSIKINKNGVVIVPNYSPSSSSSWGDHLAITTTIIDRIKKE